MGEGEEKGEVLGDSGGVDLPSDDRLAAGVVERRKRGRTKLVGEADADARDVGGPSGADRVAGGEVRETRLTSGEELLRARLGRPEAGLKEETNLDKNDGWEEALDATDR